MVAPQQTTTALRDITSVPPIMMKGLLLSVALIGTIISSYARKEFIPQITLSI